MTDTDECNSENQALIQAVGHSTAAFLGRFNDDPPKLLGSGTFVRYGKLFGVITCNHVWDAVSSWKASGPDAKVPKANRQVSISAFSVRGDNRAALSFDTDQLHAITCGRAPWKVREPDIAFVRLPPHTFGSYESLVTVRNLERQRTIYGRWQPSDRDFFCVVGTVDEWTRPGPSRKYYDSLLLRAYLSFGRLIRELKTTDGLDRFVYRPSPLMTTAPPESFGGTSGGGLWLTTVAGEGERRSIEAVFAGVAAMETRRGKIIAHGPSSIYKALVTRLEVEWPEECPPPEERASIRNPLTRSGLF